MSPFLRIVNERDKIDVGLSFQSPKRVISADPIAAIRRVRQAVREIQNPHVPSIRCDAAVSTGDFSNRNLPVTAPRKSSHVRAIAIASSGEIGDGLRSLT